MVCAQSRDNVDDLGQECLPVRLNSSVWPGRLSAPRMSTPPIACATVAVDATLSAAPLHQNDQWSVRGTPGALSTPRTDRACSSRCEPNPDTSPPTTSQFKTTGHKHTKTMQRSGVVPEQGASSAFGVWQSSSVITSLPPPKSNQGLTTFTAFTQSYHDQTSSHSYSGMSSGRSSGGYASFYSPRAYSRHCK